MAEPERSRNSGYSASVTMELQVGEERFNIASLGGGRMILRDARPLRPCAGLVRVVVDEHVSTYQVELPEGIDPKRRDQPLRTIRAVSAVA